MKGRTFPTESHLRCPLCRGAVAGGNEIRCSQCETRFSTIAGAIDFRKGTFGVETSIGEVPSELIRFANLSPEELIREICVRESKRKGSYRVQHLLEGTEYLWKLFVDPGPGLRILDLGCGYGARSASLARHGSELIAIAHDFLPAAVTAVRLARTSAPPTRHAHSVLIMSGLEMLPLKTSCIDFVVLPIDLAAGERSMWAEPCTAESLMSEVHRVLKPSGQAVLMAANRMAADRVVATMKRAVSRVYASLERHATSEVRTKSDEDGGGLRGLWTYRRMLARAGLLTEETWILVRDASHTLVALRDAQSRLLRPLGTGVKSRIKRTVAFAPEFALVAQRGRRSRAPLIERIIEAVATKLRANQTSEPALRIVRYHVSRKDKVVAELDAGGSPLILRLCLSPAAQLAEGNATAVLRDLTRVRPDATWYPRMIHAGDIDGLFFTVEAKIEGRSLSTLSTALSEAEVLNCASEVLHWLNPDIATESSVLFEGALYEALVTLPLQRLSKIVTSQVIIGRLQRAFAQRLQGLPAIVGFGHGDLSLSNALVRSDGTNALIDWENGSRETLPILDAIGFVGSVDARRDPSHLPGRARAKVAAGRLSSAQESFLAREYARGRLPRQAHAALVYLQWVHATVGNMDFSFMQQPQNIERYVDAVVRDIPEAFWVTGQVHPSG